MSQAIQRYQPQQSVQAVIPQNIQEVAEIAKMVETSKSFPTVKNAAEAAVRIMMGAEIGLGPMQSLTSIHVVEGRPTLSASLMAALMRRSGYSWRVVEHTNDVCRLEIRHNGSVVGESSFTTQEANDAQLLGRANWKKHRRDMLFARAISRAARWYAPEIALGVYLPDEMGEVEPVVVPGEPVQPTAPAEPAPVVEADVVEVQEPRSNDHDPDRAMRRLHAVGSEHGLTHEQLRALMGVESLKECTSDELVGLADEISKWPDETTTKAKALIQAQTLDELKRAWESLGKWERPVLGAAKDFRKARISRYMTVEESA